MRNQKRERERSRVTASCEVEREGRRDQGTSLLGKKSGERKNWEETK